MKAAGSIQPAASHTFRHSFATRLPERGEDSRTFQELLRYRDIETNKIYSDMLNRGPMGVLSPADIP